MENILKITPTIAATQVIVFVEKRESMPEAPFKLERQITHPVILVPKIAPRTTGIACLTFIIPEFTKPTVITDVADDD